MLLSYPVIFFINYGSNIVSYFWKGFSYLWDIQAKLFAHWSANCMDTAVETYRPEFLTMYCYGNLILWDYLICMPVRTTSLFATRTFYILHYISFVGYLILDKQEKQFLSEQFKDWGTHSNPFFSGLMAMQSGPESLNKKLASCILWFLLSEVLLGSISCQCLRIFILNSLWILQFTGNQNSLLLDKGCFSNLHSRILQDIYTIISQFCFISLHNTFSFFIFM